MVTLGNLHLLLLEQVVDRKKCSLQQEGWIWEQEVVVLSALLPDLNSRLNSHYYIKRFHQ